MTTEHRKYPEPDESRDIADEFPALRIALRMVDGDIHALMEAMNQVAAKAHEHVIDDITGLRQVLDGKMAANKTFTLAGLSDVVGMAEAPDGYVLVKLGTEMVAMSAVTALGEGNVLLRANNFSDVQDKPEARKALGVVGYGLAGGANADTLFEPGKYIFGSTWIGSPFAGANGSNQGYVEVDRWGSDAYVLQVFTPVNGKHFKLQRRRDNGEWEPWRHIHVGKITISSEPPTGGMDGDIWLQVDP